MPEGSGVRMEKQKKDLLIASVLVAVCVFLLWNNLFSKKRPDKSQSAPSQIQTTEFDLNIIQEIRQSEKMSANEKNLWRKEWGRDPFVSVDSSAGVIGLTDIKISGIVWDKTRPLAVINGEVHTVGDTIKGHTIVEIKVSSVILSAGDEKIEMPLFRSNQTRSVNK